MPSFYIVSRGFHEEEGVLQMREIAGDRGADGLHAGRGLNGMREFGWIGESTDRTHGDVEHAFQ